MKVYKIRHKITERFKGKGDSESWTKVGNTWSLKGINAYIKRFGVPDGAEIIEYELLVSRLIPGELCSNGVEDPDC